MELTREKAARVALHFQRLGRQRPKASHTTVLDIVQTLGSLQIDTINVVERSPHLVLYSRLENYSNKILEELLFKERKLCEYLTNVSAIIPIHDYPYYFYAWVTRPRPNSWTQRIWLPKNRNFVEKIRRLVPKDRPFSTDDFEESLQRRLGGWSGSELSRALDHMVTEGSLMIHHREGPRKFYARRKKPQSRFRTSEVDDQKLLRFLLRRSLAAMGIGTLREIQLARAMPAKDYNQEANSMVDDGTLDVLSVKGIRDTYYALREQRDQIEAAREEPAPDDQATLLSPFDNLIINRQRTFKLFGFYPRFEAYVPKEKRKYGYYNMPILYKEKLLGYVDLKLDRKTSVMIFQTLNLDRTPDEKMRSALVEEFTRFLRLHNAERLEVKSSQPPTIAKKIQTEVDRALRQS